MSNLPPLSLYIHIPWCEKKCPYCDFNSHVQQAIPEQDYVHKLIEDLKHQLHLVKGRKLLSLFFGGGTPSLFKPESIAKIINAAEHYIGFDDDIEITLEANPSSSEYKKFKALKSTGVNRLSIGVQSFNNKSLKALGRLHDQNDAINAIKEAQNAGFDQLNIDLMHSLPKQNQASALKDLQIAMQFNVPHISWYELTIEPNTVFYNSPPKLPDESCLNTIFENGFNHLLLNQYQQYEVSAFCLEQNYAKHNLNYWQFGDYLAIGAGAHGKATNENEIWRFYHTRSPKDYLNQVNFQQQKLMKISPSEALFEALLNGLRLKEGLQTNNLLAFSHSTYEALTQLIQAKLTDELISVNKEYVRTTHKGYQYLNSLLVKLMA